MYAYLLLKIPFFDFRETLANKNIQKVSVTAKFLSRRLFGEEIVSTSWTISHCDGVKKWRIWWKGLKGLTGGGGKGGLVVGLPVR